MKKIFILLLLLLFCHIKSFAQDAQSTKIRADAAASSSYSAVGNSISIWGVVLAAGVVAAVLFIKSSSGTSAHS